jgi:hypothetical protein
MATMDRDIMEELSRLLSSAIFWEPLASWMLIAQSRWAARLRIPWSRKRAVSSQADVS